VLFAQTWLLVFGAVFLAQELYETGVVALVLRSGRRESPG
jgi:NhaP-type Na+/H+ or K+/H+ antiporter